MKARLLFLLLLSAGAVFGQSQVVRTGGYDFVFRTQTLPNENGDSIRQVTLYRDKKPLLTHVLYRPEGDCNSESIELGAFETTDATITFYSYWARAGDAPVSPFGVRKQVYSVGQNGSLRRTGAFLYVETVREGWPENKGIKYLFTPPRNAAEKQQLETYIRAVETSYGGRFMQGPAKAALFGEVRAKLKKPIAEATGHWENDYADKLGGYKK